MHHGIAHNIYSASNATAVTGFKHSIFHLIRDRISLSTVQIPIVSPRTESYHNDLIRFEQAW